MANKRKLRSQDDVQETTLPSPSEEAVPREIASRLSLAEIRSDALKSRTATEHIIADLESWIAEMQSTVAFLKAGIR